MAEELRTRRRRRRLQGVDLFRQAVALLVLAIVATSCQMLSGQQFEETADSYYLSADATEQFRDYVVNDCAGDASCLVAILTSLFGDEQGDTDAAGDQVVQLLTTEAQAGTLDAVFAAATTGDCVKLPKAGGAQVELASSANCSDGTDMLKGVVCSFTVAPTDTVGVTWKSWPESVAVTVERSVDGGVFLPINTAASDDVEFHDLTAPPGSSLEYRVESADAAADCTESLYEEGIDASSLGLSFDENGVLVKNGSGLEPVAMSLYSANSSASTAAAALDLCQTGSLSMQLPQPKQTRVWTKVTIPQGATFVFDVVNRKEQVGENGNWSGDFDLHRINGDGSVGPEVADINGTGPPFYWGGVENVRANQAIYTNTGAAEEFFFSYVLFISVSIYGPDGASVHATNPRFEDGSGNLIGRPCDAQQIADCQASTPNPFWTTETVTFEGQTYRPGCYEYESCIPTLPLVGVIQEWGCENDDFLRHAAIVLGLAVVVVGGVVYLGPAALSAITAGGEVGAITVGQSLAGGAAALAGIYVVVAITSSGPIEIPILEDFSGAVTGAGDAITDVLQGATPTITRDGSGDWAVSDAAVDIMVDRSNYEQQFEADWSEPLRSNGRNLFRYALRVCLVSMTFDAALEIMSRLNINPADQTSLFGFNLDGSNRHVCEFIDIYVPAGRNHKSPIPMSHQTLHIREALYDEAFPSASLQTPVHVGTQPPPGQSGWRFLHREKNASRVSWYRASPYTCEANQPFACDEWPWNATQEGGKPASGETQPHLRIMLGTHNRNGGTDFGSFVSGARCNVQDEEIFMVIPAPASALVVNYSPAVGSVLEFVPSQFFCEQPLS